jgi:AmmeMemoRadiSam system protein A
MASTDQPLLNEDLRSELLDIAAESIRHGLTQGGPLPVYVENYSPELQQQRACFVTLHRSGNLRGCIGHLEAIQALVKDVADNAYAAAFRDPRFPPVNPEEVNNLDIHISVLTPSEPLEFDSEQDLLGKIRPGVDGLILEEKNHRGTFLPSVWESLPQPRDFLQHLKLKAGLPGNYWSDRIRIYRYTSESFPD